EVVGDPACQLPERFHFLRMSELLLARAQRGVGAAQLLDGGERQKARKSPPECDRRKDRGDRGRRLDEALQSVKGGPQRDHVEPVRCAAQQDEGGEEPQHRAEDEIAALSADNDEPERDGEVGEGDRGVRKRVEPNQSRLPEKTESVRLQPGVAKEPLAQCGQHRNSPIDPYPDLVNALVTPQHFDRLVKHIRMRLREKTHVIYFAIPLPPHQTATVFCSKYVVAQIVCANRTEARAVRQEVDGAMSGPSS